MEKSSLVLNEQLCHLKKSLKNKRNSEIWEQSIQFYRNNQSNLTSYHILKIIKIAMKPLRSTIMKNCTFVAKLSARCSKRPDDNAKLREELWDQVENLRAKNRVLQNLLDCYTLAIQTVLMSSDPSYFNMMHRQNYHAFHSKKQLIFESATLESEAVLSRDMLEHQMSGYFRFVCQAITLSCMSLLCWAPEPCIAQFITKADLNLEAICQSSTRFSKSRVKYECIKLNYMSRYPHSKLVVEYHFPLETFHRLYKEHRKWEAKQVKHYYNLLVRYVFLSLANISNPNLFYEESRYLGNPNISSETEIYIYMKEMLSLYQLINYKLRNGLDKYLLQFMSAVVDSYEARLHEMQVWKQVLAPYFPYASLQALATSPNHPIDKESLVTGLACHEDNSPTNPDSKEHKNSIRKVSNVEQVKKGRDRRGSVRLDCIIERVGDFFNYIEESDSDDGEVVHQFERQRLEEIATIQQQINEHRRRNRSAYIQGSQPLFMENQEVSDKMAKLNQKNKEFQRETVAALHQLGTKKHFNKLEQKLYIIQQQHSVLPSPALVQEQHPPAPKPTSIGKSRSHWGETRLGGTGNKKKEEAVIQKPSHPILLSDKYDRMSRNLLLTSSNRQSNKQSAIFELGR